MDDLAQLQLAEAKARDAEAAIEAGLIAIARLTDQAIANQIESAFLQAQTDVRRARSKIVRERIRIQQTNV